MIPALAFKQRPSIAAALVALRSIHNENKENDRQRSPRNLSPPSQNQKNKHTRIAPNPIPRPQTYALQPPEDAHRRRPADAAAKPHSPAMATPTRARKAVSQRESNGRHTVRNPLPRNSKRSRP